MSGATSSHDTDRKLVRRSRAQGAQSGLYSASPALSHAAVQRAASEGNALAAHEVMSLQRTMGNQAVLGLLNRAPSAPAPAVQRALAVGPVDDRYEREAEQVAQSVMGSSRGSQLPASSATQSGKPSVQRSAVGPEGGALSGDVESRLRQSQSSGSGLPNTVRGQLEPKLGADLSQVKVHTDKAAVQLTQEMGAKAFTHKNHIYYGAGHSPNDLKLTAHETVHTIQQGAISQNAQRSPDEEITHTTKPTLSRAPATIQRFGWWDRRKRRQVNMTDEDLVDQTRGEGGSQNRVDKVKYQRGIGGSKVKSGFFKPNTQDEPEMANHAVASSLLDKWLGLNMLPEEVWANHGGEQGSVSATVPGSPLQESEFNTPVDDDKVDEDNGTKFKRKDEQWYKFSGVREKYHDFSNPRTQKGLFDLQLLDAITGQRDRHGGNIYVDDKTGKVKGIDNDQAFELDSNYIDNVDDKYHGLPNLVDKRTAKKILKKKAKNLPKVLGSKYGGNLSPEEIKNTQDRMRAVKRHLKQLKKDKKLVNKWDEKTYLQALDENDKQGTYMGKAVTFAPNILKRVVTALAGSNNRDALQEDEFSFGENPLYETNELEEEEGD